MAIASDMSGQRSALERARAALHDVQDDPRRSLQEALELVGADLGDDVRVVALWAEGQAHRELNEIGPACAALRKALELAAVTGDEQLEARIRMSFSLALFSSGQEDEAFRQLDAAAERLTGTERDRVEMQRGLLQFQLGDLEDAVRSFDAAMPGALAEGDRLAEARLRINRAAACTSLGRLRAAETDLLVVQRLGAELDQKLIAAGAEHNLGFLASRRGDVPTALRWYDRAQSSYEALAEPRRLVAELDSDRCEVLLAAGLSAEAMEAAARVVAAHARDGNETSLAEAQLLLARAHLSAGQFPEAHAVAESCRSRFARRRAWAALAAYVAIQAQVLARDGEIPLGADLLDRTVRLAGELDELGWKDEALHVRSFAVRVGLQQGDLKAARQQLERAARARLRGPAAQRVQAWHATATLRHLEGNPAGAFRALHAGLRLVDEARSGVGSSELRATVAHHGADLAELGLQLARATGRGRAVLAWLERSRALALLAPPVRPPDDEAFAAELAALRQARSEARERIVASQDPDGAQRRVLRLERSVRDRARQASGTGRIQASSILADDLAGLGEHVLVEYLRHDGRLLALVVRDGRVSQHDLGPAEGLDAELEFLSFALHRLARHHGSEGSRLLAAQSLVEVGTRVGERLLGPLSRRLEQRPTVIVPDPSLHRVPWAVLPQLNGRPFSVSPSLRAFQQASRLAAASPPRTGEEALLIAGPGLPGARDEVARLAELHPHALVLAGADATTGAVCEALGNCRLAHVACHGKVRLDNPLFSSLTMVDGELTVYDLEQCAGMATTVILSACYSGLGTVVTGSEVLGLSSALLSLGCATVIAPVAPVSDQATAAIMVPLHERLQRGQRSSVALMEARPEPTDGADRCASWMAFSVYGAG